jgi:hypothetical protein
MAALASGRTVAAFGGAVVLRFPFNRELVDELKLAVPIRHRHWDKGEKVWRVAGAYAKAAIDALLDHHPRAEVPTTYARIVPVVKTRPSMPVMFPAADLEVSAPTSSQISATVMCPKCRKPYEQSIRVSAVTSATAAKRAITPEVVAVCPSCNTLAVVAFHPLATSASA